MKRKYSTALVLVSVLSTPVLAETEGSGIYFGLKTGALEVDVSGFNFDTPVGLYGGFAPGVWGIEFEVVTASGDFSGVDLDFDSLAVYGVYRSEGEIYIKGKGGFLRQEVSVNTSGFGRFNETDTGVSFGVGVGARIDNISFEAEYTFIEEDATLFSVGGRVCF
ncbi:MAG: hypothetical protein COB04_04425 [Gammaproteobacteria bacterium]|nr:MAG: hypothetical protein COB04_04425 [Gammaproteobacteria bacterium]